MTNDQLYDLMDEFDDEPSDLDCEAELEERQEIAQELRLGTMIEPR